jgi:phage protein U
MGYEIPKSTIGSLGQLPFICSWKKVLTFSDLSRENSARWAKHEVIGKKPVLEFVGEDLSSVSLSIRFDKSLGIPPAKGLARLKDMLENRLYKTLIIGGEYLGRYVIEQVSETRKFHDGNGVCLVATATIKLTEWAR